MITELTDNGWTYRMADPTDLWSRWTITTPDGRVLDETGRGIPECRRIAFEASRTESAVTYTIASGPGRAQQTRRHTD